MKIWWWTVGTLAVIEAVALAWMMYRLRAIAGVRSRLDRMGDAMTLLTDTTEAGLSALAAEVARVAPRRTQPASPRRALAKRLSSAVRRGDDIVSIASREGLSESEIRLHLAMSQVESVAAAPVAAPAIPLVVAQPASPAAAFSAPPPPVFSAPAWQVVTPPPHIVASAPELPVLTPAPAPQVVTATVVPGRARPTRPVSVPAAAGVRRSAKDRTPSIAKRPTGNTHGQEKTHASMRA